MAILNLVPTKFPAVTLAVVSLICVLHLFPQSFELFYYNSDYFSQGEWWRLFTSQWVHLDLKHLGYNVGAVLILGWLLEQDNRIQLLPLLISGMIAVGIFLPLGSLWRYCGLSGAIAALILPVIWTLWQKDRSIFPWIIGALYLMRLIVELISGQPLIADLEWPSYPPAHLIGLAVGAIWVSLRIVGQYPKHEN